MFQDPFGNIGNVRPSVDGNYFQPGKHVVRIDACKLDKNRTGQAIFVIETTILATERPKANPVNSSASQVISFAHDSALGNIKAFILSMLPFLSDADVNSAVAHWTTSDGAGIDPRVYNALPPALQQPIAAGQLAQTQPLRGVLAEVFATNVKTRAGGDFTKHAWSPLPAGAPIPVLAPSADDTVAPAVAPSDHPPQGQPQFPPQGQPQFPPGFNGGR
jgi:hypothetical protein